MADRPERIQAGPPPGPSDVTVQGGAVLSPSSAQTIGTLLVASNGWVQPRQSNVSTVSWQRHDPGRRRHHRRRHGQPGRLGTGAGGAASTSSGYVGGGGGYGGYGASGARNSGYSAYGGNTYGSVTAPTELGSGGGGSSSPLLGGAGGGAIRLTVTGTLEVDGRISARGLAGTGSGGGGLGRQHLPDGGNADRCGRHLRQRRRGQRLSAAGAAAGASRSLIRGPIPSPG